jgi:hypothetical protein
MEMAISLSTSEISEMFHMESTEVEEIDKSEIFAFLRNFLGKALP